MQVVLAVKKKVNMKTLNGLNIVILTAFLLVFSGASVAKISAIIDDGGGGGGSEPLTITSPTTSSPVTKSEGESVNLGFTYNYTCPTAYGIEVYADNDIGNLVCSKYVTDLGWTVYYSYGQPVSCVDDSDSHTISDVCGLSTSTPGGSYTSKITLFDRYGNVGTSATMPSSVIVEATEANLKVDSVSLSATEVNEGGTVTATAVVSNDGARDASNVTVTAYYTSSSIALTSFESKSVASLAVGTSSTLTFTWNTEGMEPDNYTIKVEVDPGNSIEEQNETDNNKRAGVYVAASEDDSPDLVIQSFSSDKLTYAVGEEIEFTVVVLNQGKAAAGSFYVSVDTSPMKSTSLSGLGVGETGTVTFTATASLDWGPEKTFTAGADSGGVVAESSETNNQAELSLGFTTAMGVPLKPLLTVESATIVTLQDVEKPDQEFEAPVPAEIFVSLYTNESESETGKTLLELYQETPFCIQASGANEYSFTAAYAYNSSKGIPDEANGYLDFLYNYGSLMSSTLKDSSGALEKDLDYLGNIFLREDGLHIKPDKLHMASGSYSFQLNLGCSDSVALVSFTLKFLTEETCDGEDNDGDRISDNGCDLAIESVEYAQGTIDKMCPQEITVMVKNTGTMPSPEVSLATHGQNIMKKRYFDVPALEPGQSHEIKFYADYSLTGTPGIIYYSLDPDDGFPEVNDQKRDNTDNDQVTRLGLTQNNTSRSTITALNPYPDLKTDGLEFGRSPAVFKPGENISFDLLTKNAGLGEAQSAELALSIIKEGEKEKIESMQLDYGGTPGAAIPECGLSNYSSAAPIPAELSGVVDEFRIFSETGTSAAEYSISRVDFEREPTGKCFITAEKNGTTTGIAEIDCTARTCAPIYEVNEYNKLDASDNRTKLMLDSIGRVCADFSNWTGGESATYGAESIETAFFGEAAVTKTAVSSTGIKENESTFTTAENFRRIQGNLELPGYEGNMEFEACLDPENAFYEYNENDNCIILPITITSKPNLNYVSVDAIIVDEADSGRFLRVKAKVKNIGADTAQKFKVSAFRTYWKRTQKLTTIIDELPENGKETTRPRAGGIRAQEASGRAILFAEGEEEGGEIVEVRQEMQEIEASKDLEPNDEEEIIISIPEEELKDSDKVLLLLDSENNVEEANEDNEYGFPVPEEIRTETCGNGTDDDWDGLVDEGCAEICGNGTDDDGDGEIDEGCIPFEEICGNGIDDDLDGLIDEGCEIYARPKEICGDGKDNDWDGYVDEDCGEAKEICGDGIDNDLDGLVDEGCPESREPEEIPEEVIKEAYKVKPTKENSDSEETEFSVGDKVRLVLEHKDLGNLGPGVSVEITAPDGTVSECVTNENGECFVDATQVGIYTAKANIQGYAIESRFETGYRSQSIVASMEEAVSIIFGSGTTGEGANILPILLILSFVAAVIAYLRLGYYTKKEVVPAGKRNAEGFVKAVLALVFFALPLAVNRFYGFRLAFIVVVAELIIIFVYHYMVLGRKRKKRTLKL